VTAINYRFECGNDIINTAVRKEQTMARTIHNLFCRACVIILVAEVLTGCLLTAGCAKGHRQAEAATTNHAASPKAGSRAIEITVLYDNYTLSEGFRTGWGFSCIITGTEKCVLFDTGANADLLLENMDKLQVRAQDVDLVVISHDHDDHTLGLYSFLSRNSNVLVYLPISGSDTRLIAHSAELARGVESRGAKVQIPDAPLQICEGVHVAGLPIMGWVDAEGQPIRGIVEQFLVLDTDKGLVVITGCAHPGIVEIVQKAKQMLNKDVYLVFGGFHLLDQSDSQIQSIIRQFRELGVQKVGASHCTGDKPIELFKQEYREDFVPIGVGRISIPGKLWPATNATPRSAYSAVVAYK
jgi:7,8-dihydropterin-6-yl-methyl-4-(beta-D-ribofuranosyl)aminobenzene 5'-phosphate synthase